MYAPILITLKVTFAVRNLTNSYTSGNAIRINYNMFTHELECKSGLLVISTVVLKLEKDSRSLAVMYTVSDNTLEMVQDRNVARDHEQEVAMTNRTVTIQVTLSNIQGHSPVASLLKWGF